LAQKEWAKSVGYFGAFSCPFVALYNCGGDIEKPNAAALDFLPLQG
jgi:hypothetical protein